MEQTNRRFLIFASDTEAQTEFNDELAQQEYSKINKQKRELETANELTRLGVRHDDIEKNNIKVKKLTDELNHLDSLLCNNMNTYLIGYAPVFRSQSLRNKMRDNYLKKCHQKHDGDFKNCKDCHQIEKRQVSYFIAKSSQVSAWKLMLDDLVARYRKYILNGSTHTALIYFHNLNYDVQNLIQYMVDHEDKFSGIKICNSNNSWYSLKFVYRECCFELRDSFKLYAQPLKALATLVGWDKLTEEATYSWFDLNNKEKFDDELEYFIFDINILVHVLEMHFDKFAHQRIELTAPGYAEKELKKCVREDDKQRKVQKKKPYYSKIFNTHIKDDEEQYLRRAYYGGFVYANHHLINQKLKRGITADVNSLYPSVMLNRNYPNIYSHRELSEQEFNSLDKSDLETFAIVKIQISKLSLKKNGVPCFPKKAGFGVPKDILSLNDLLGFGETVANINLTLLDLYHIEQNYDIKYCFVNGIIFDEKMERPFTTFVLKHKKEKEDAVRRGDMVSKLIAKMMLNSCYGKFAQRQIEEDEYLIKDVNGLPAIQRASKLHDEDAKRHNILLGVYVTAFARDVLLNAIEKIQKSDLAEFWYCDTDSVHFGYKGEKDYIKDASEILQDIGIPFDTAEFGKWKDEQYMEEAKYLGSKRYWEFDPVRGSKGKDPNVIKGAGIQQIGKQYLEQQGIDAFNYDDGNTIWVPFKVSKKVYNGIKIYMDYKEIKPSHWQYKFLS